MTGTKLIALRAKQAPTPTEAISTPAIAGPTMRVALLRLELSAIAFGNSAAADELDHHRLAAWGC